MNPCINILNNTNNRRPETANTALSEANSGYLQTWIGWQANPKKEYTTLKLVPSKRRLLVHPPWASPGHDGCRKGRVETHRFLAGDNANR